MAKPMLDKLIEHYSRIAREQGGNPAHYAAGVRDALLAVRKVRDEHRGEQTALWRQRQGQGENDPLRVLHRMHKMFADDLDRIEDPATIGTVSEAEKGSG
jgi:hypothetical protein